MFAPEVASRTTTAAGLNFAAPPSAFNPDFSALLQEDTPLRARDQPGTLDSALYMVKQALGGGATFTTDTSPISNAIYATRFKVSVMTPAGRVAPIFAGRSVALLHLLPNPPSRLLDVPIALLEWQLSCGYAPTDSCSAVASELQLVGSTDVIGRDAHADEPQQPAPRDGSARVGAWGTCPFSF